MSDLNSDPNVFRFTFKDGGKVTVDRSRIAENCERMLLRRAIQHVIGNEAAAKVDEGLTGPERAAALDTIRQDYIDRMYSGEWGTGARQPRTVGADRAETLFMIAIKGAVMKIFNAAVKRAKRDAAGNLIDGAEVTTVDGIKTWRFSNGETRTLEQSVARYLANPNNAEDIAKARAAAKIKADAEVQAASLSRPSSADFEELGL